MADETWTTQDQRRIAVGDMTEAHVRNTLKMIDRASFTGTIDEARDRLRHLLRERRLALGRLIFNDKPWVDI